MELISQITGWIGMTLMVSAYYLVSHKKLNSHDTSYQLMNLFGAIGLGLNVLYQKAWPALAFEVLWIVIAITALIKHGRNADPMDMTDLS